MSLSDAEIASINAKIQQLKNEINELTSDKTAYNNLKTQISNLVSGNIQTILDRLIQEESTLATAYESDTGSEYETRIEQGYATLASIRNNLNDVISEIEAKINTIESKITEKEKELRKAKLSLQQGPIR